jgi:pimeloyl-ACP methyl ester carboxylesterase
LWHYVKTGSGRPLILLHGIGMSHVVWNAVTPRLATTRQVIAFDIAGFGLTPPLPARLTPTVANLVDDFERSIRALGLDLPFDIAGNSLGGWMALEAARRGLARTVVAIGPAGLWKTQPPFHVKFVFGGMRFMARHFASATKAAMRSAALRELLLAVPLSAGSRRMSGSEAIQAIDDLASAATFEETFERTRAPFSGGRQIAVPVTIAFGDRDRILPRCSRTRLELPAHARWIEVRGWGHVPMWVDPLGVSRLILEGTA